MSRERIVAARTRAGFSVARILVAAMCLAGASVPTAGTAAAQPGAREPLVVSTGGGNPPPPDRLVTELTGIGTDAAHMVATLDAARIADNCHNFNHIYDIPLEECDARAQRDPRLGETSTASARCIEGSLVDWEGRRLTRRGTWPAGTLWNDRPLPRFVDSATGAALTLDNASGGRVAARLWEILCTDMHRHQATDVVAAPPRKPATTLARAPQPAPVPAPAPMPAPEPVRYAGAVYAAMHNGSRMSVDTRAGTIVYLAPRSGMARTVAPGQVLFYGTFYADGWVDGTAFTFKRGCAPLPYRVSGEMYGDGTIVLRGTAQRRDPNSCRSLGLNLNSPHGELVFTPVR